MKDARPAEWKGWAGGMQSWEDLPMASAVGFVYQRGVPALIDPRVSRYCRLVAPRWMEE